MTRSLAVLVLSLGLLVACVAEGDDPPLAGEAFDLGVGSYALGALAGNGKCLDVAEGARSDGTNIREWTCNGTGAQLFRVETYQSGVHLVNPQSGKCVSVAGNASADRTNVRLWTCIDNGSQTFRSEDLGDGTTRFVHLSSGKCLDVDSAGTADGTNVQLYTCNGTAAQRWRPSRSVRALRIMPLGASITQGVGGTHAGYRYPLGNLLDARGVAHTFVGSSTENPGPLPADQRHHEGHPGYVIAAGTSGRPGLAEHLDAWLGPNGADPDYVLLLVGSNDVDLSYQLAQAGARMAALLTRIAALRPDAQLLVATLPMINDPTTEARVRTYNADVARVVAERRTAGLHVRLVDVHALITLADKHDNLHPNDAGYDKIARAWLDAILQ